MLKNSLYIVDLNEFINNSSVALTDQFPLSQLNDNHGHAYLFCTCIWFGQQNGGRLTTNELKKLIDVFDRWQQSVIHNLAELNHCVNNLDSISVQKDSQALVEFADHAAINMLQDNIPALCPHNKNQEQRIKDSCANLIKYIKVKKYPYTPQREQQLVHLLQHAFPDESKLNIEQLYENIVKKAKIRSTDFYQLSLANL